MTEARTGRSTGGRILALPLGVAAAACLGAAWIAFSGPGGGEEPGLPPMIAAGLAGLLVVLAAVCLLGASLAWRGRLSGGSAPVPTFGRAGSGRGGPPPLPRMPFILVGAIALLTASATYMALVPAPAPAPVEVEAEPEPEPQPDPDRPSDIVEAPETTTPAEEEQPPEPQEAAPPPTTVAPPPAQAETPPATPGAHTDAVVWLALGPDGRSLLSASIDQSIKLWDLAGETPPRDIGRHNAMARVALFRPGRDEALTAADDGEIVLRALDDGAVLHVFSAPGEGSVRGLAMTPDGRRFVSAHQSGNVFLWDMESAAAPLKLEAHVWPVNGVAVSPDGSRAVTGDIDGMLALWDLDGGERLRSWKGHDRGVYGAVFQPDGRHVVTGSGDYSIKIWDIETGDQVRRLDGHAGTVYAVALSPDGQRLASGSLDGSARVWDVETGRELAQFRGHSGPALAVTWQDDDTVLSGGADATIRRWQAQSGQPIGELAAGAN